MSEHPDIASARHVLAEAELALAEALKGTDQTQVNIWEGAVAAAKRQLDRAITQASK